MIDETLLEAEDKMDKAVSVAKDDFAGIRTGRVTPSMFNKISAEYYGTPTPFSNWPRSTSPRLAWSSFSPSTRARWPRSRRRSATRDLGVNPGNDGMVIRVAFPELSEERRKEYIKVARNKAEQSKVSIRNIRRHAKETLDKMVKDSEVGEDEVRRAEKELDDLTQKHVAEIDELLKHKEAELLEV